MTKILVAGRSGQVARCLFEEAVKRGIELVAYGRPELDLEDARSIEQVVRKTEPSAIVNAAAYTAVDRAEAEPDKAFAINCHGAALLAVEAQKRRVPLVHISTDYVFDGLKMLPYTEEDQAAPLGVYGRSKLQGEAIVLRNCETALVLRTSWIYSPFGHNFLRNMMRLSRTDNLIRVVDDQCGRPTAANDLANAILDVLQQLDDQGIGSRTGIYHLAAEGETTWYGFADAIFDGCAKRGFPVAKLIAIKSGEYPALARRPANSRLNCTKIDRQFGIRLPPWKLSLHKCLDRLLNEEESQPC